MSQKIQIRRGTKNLLPALDVGEPGITTDTKEFFIGATGGNIEFASILSGGYKIQSGSVAGTNQTYTSSTNYLFPVTFPIAFTTIPIIDITLSSGMSAGAFTNVSITSMSTTGFSCVISYGGTTTTQPIFQWVAIGS